MSRGAFAAAGTPAGWKDDGATLTAPNGVWYVLAHNWNPQDEPQVAEYAATPVEYSDPAAGDGNIQPFALTGQLCWTPAKGVYAAHAGAEIFALRKALEAALKTRPPQPRPLRSTPYGKRWPC